ncbi:PHD finger protein ALFIN-LIKE 3-like isoform X2 [Cucumis melo var. makuwa]|uniref:PHD finger protein ALFIN-LIKE 3-like isoform X2 n=1 Tax=Cucumis melo var. makuwa TaxID=1194695 RepID=A0A5D3DBA8_CUCMM|nr:PHD finger protein ALFIN-LIKE 3-like isoform X2 [Cucumis melo var. makuwa]TYK20901.1 PHD finger protein ALFIN-LIKE 3-like isoform X2 [Cucumis melo var. makuwa]
MDFGSREEILGESPREFSPQQGTYSLSNETSTGKDVFSHCREGMYARQSQAREEVKMLSEEDEDEHGDTLHGACDENYASDEFLIYCDICEK